MARKANIPSRDDHVVDDEKVTSHLEQLADESVDGFEFNDATGSEVGSDMGESSTSNDAGRMDGNDADKESDKRGKEEDMESRPSVEELRERLTQKIKSLRAARKAPGSGIPGAPLNREAILKARKAKDQHRKEALKRKRAAEEEVKQLADADGKLITQPTSTETDDIDTSNAVFSKVTLKSGEVIAANGEIQPKKRKKGPVDLLGQLKHVEAKKARIASMDKEKRATIEEKEKWKRAIKQTEGDKVKDDERMLKKSLKKQLKRKLKSAKEWQEREENVLKGIKARQKKREENIAARKEMKVKGKKSKGKSSAKKKKRPGFEGGIKRKRK
ncbi:surfeit locus protein 6-domain-containing protein [Lipomyces tetrasporus]|uniref:Surfeit locus protein 6-domain-containing protein n=1 Tax=Lipomyces tetrasporus TaxID=54092 RepID=A0AAD7QNW9_9ASCO|nr:surfeit locus protein 6-domain-containing protein [Lipomyces tetrasporus]KAJ8098810.1 surfeit locus protein 6-domain-containing protein [Lipomyces tetrasporus]